MNTNIPIYIISFNRLTCLQASIESYLSFSSYSNLIILDNGSDYKPLLEYYKILEEKGVKIIKSKKAKTRQQRALLHHKITEENLKRNCQYYVVSDPDIAFTNAPSNTLIVYIEVLNKLNVDVVGPMLTIIDIPESYPVREFAWKRHVEQFWHKKPKTLNINDKKIYYQRAQIDTTFGLFKSSTKWERRLSGARVYNPYEAKHLDWYISGENLTADQKYYFESVKNVEMSHWGGQFLVKKPFHILPNFMRSIHIVVGNRITNHKLKKSNAYIKMIIPLISIPFKRFINDY